MSILSISHSAGHSTLIPGLYVTPLEVHDVANDEVWSERNKWRLMNERNGDQGREVASNELPVLQLPWLPHFKTLARVQKITANGSLRPVNQAFSTSLPLNKDIASDEILFFGYYFTQKKKIPGVYLLISYCACVFFCYECVIVTLTYNSRRHVSLQYPFTHPDNQ